MRKNVLILILGSSLLFAGAALAQTPDFAVPLDQDQTPYTGPNQLMDTVRTMDPRLFRATPSVADIAGTWKVFAKASAKGKNTGYEPYRDGSIVLKPNAVSNVVPGTVALPEFFFQSMIERKGPYLALTDPTSVGVSWECRFFRYEVKTENKNYMLCTTPGGTGATASERIGLFFVRRPQS